MGKESEVRRFGEGESEWLKPRWRWAVVETRRDGEDILGILFFCYSGKWGEKTEMNEFEVLGWALSTASFCDNPKHFQFSFLNSTIIDP